MDFSPATFCGFRNDADSKLLAYQLIGRQEYPGRVLRVEYQLTDRGEKLAAILKQLRDLDATHAVRKPARRTNTSTQAG